MCESAPTSGSFMYQEDWTEDFRSKSDADFVVEDVGFPIHSIFFYQSKVLQGCFSDTTNPGKISLKSCFNGTTKKDMDNFLCQVYGNGDPLELLNGDRLLKVIDLAIKLDCPRVLKYVRSNLERSPDIVKRDVSKGGENALCKWLGVSHALSSTSITDVLFECALNTLSNVLDKHGEDRWASLLNSIPPDWAHKLTYSLCKEKGPIAQQETKQRMYFASQCNSCDRWSVHRRINGNMSI